MFGTIGIIGSRRADLDAALAEIERLRVDLQSSVALLAEARKEIMYLKANAIVAWHDRKFRPVQAHAADADEVLSDFWNCPVGDALPITTAPNTPAAACVRQPADDLTIPPVPFNALRWSR